MNKNTVLVILARFSRYAFLVLVGSLAMHIFVLTGDYLLVDRFTIDLKSDFLSAAFSFPMLPVVGAYAFLLAIGVVLWHRASHAIAEAHRVEMELNKQEAVRTALQKLTVSMAESLAVHNAEIVRWIDLQNRRGNQVSDRLVNASRGIGEALANLSRLAFDTGYHDPRALLEAAGAEAGESVPSRPDQVAGGS
ncbi:MAG: hypothetical protein H7A21_12885 [Spirochaetales bacterium]|nr:hypothetical protein [Leptospiraceae bacterium]MCP5482323.1 hypothetical protein [Spirochaetales bacterium]MCP5484238.1 hypothetical protein [Spirochaetales bacterium]